MLSCSRLTGNPTRAPLRRVGVHEVSKPGHLQAERRVSPTPSAQSAASGLIGAGSGDAGQTAAAPGVASNLTPVRRAVATDDKQLWHHAAARPRSRRVRAVNAPSDRTTALAPSASRTTALHSEPFRSRRLLPEEETRPAGSHGYERFATKAVARSPPCNLRYVSRFGSCGAGCARWGPLTLPGSQERRESG